MIHRLTVYQEEKLSIYREKWLHIERSIGPCDRQRVEESIEDCYRCSGLKVPQRMIWVGSPSAAISKMCSMDAEHIKIWNILSVDGWHQIIDNMSVHVRATVEEELTDRFLELDIAIKDLFFEYIKDKHHSDMRDKIWTMIYRCGGGVHDARWLSGYAYYLEQFDLKEIEPMRSLFSMAEAGCGWWWPFENIVILSDLPSAIHLDDFGQLHCDDGPSVEYPDGFSVYAIHGKLTESKE